MRVASPLLTTSLRALAGHCGSWPLHTLEVPMLEATFIGSEAATAALYLPQPSAFVAPASDHVPPGHVPLLMGCPSLRRPRRPLHGSNESGMFSPATAGRRSSGRGCQLCCGSASSLAVPLLATASFGTISGRTMVPAFVFFALLQLLGRSAADIVREDTERGMATFLMDPHCTSRVWRPNAFLSM